MLIKYFLNHKFLFCDTEMIVLTWKVIMCITKNAYTEIIRIVDI
jgi:hypothetical protein